MAAGHLRVDLLEALEAGRVHLPPVREWDEGGRRHLVNTLLEEVARRHIWLMLRHQGGSRSRSAREPGIARTTLLQKIARYGLEDAGR